MSHSILKPTSRTKSKSRSSSRSRSRSRSRSHSKSQSITAAADWVPVYNKQFPDWVTQRFRQYELSNQPSTIPKDNTFRPFPYQQFLTAFMREPSPYRGILLWHSLGSGKTCTAIQIAEGLKDGRQIIIMIPASLRDNFIQKGILYCADPRYVTNESLWRNKYTFVSYNASNVRKQLEDIGTLDNKVIIIEEVHNLVSRITSSLIGNSKNGRYLYQRLMTARNTKIIAMSGTPIINSPAELGILFNILRGNIEISVFKIKDGNMSHAPRLEETILSIPGVDYAELRLGNRTIETHVQAKSYNTTTYRNILQQVITTVRDKLAIDISPLMIRNYSLFPDRIESGDFTEFLDYFINEDDDGFYHLKNRNLFQRRILGLISYYWIRDKTYPSVTDHGMIRIPMSDYQYNLYDIVRIQERAREKAAAKKKRAGMAVKTMFRVFSREFSNFVYPDEISRPFPSQEFERIVRMAMTRNNNPATMKRIEELLQREFNMSEASVEGEVGDIDTTTDDDNAKRLRKNKRYLERLRETVTRMKARSNEFLSREALATYSPKMLAVLRNIDHCNGNIFIYSQFTMLEGAEMIAMVLQQEGYRVWNDQHVPVPGEKRYALFTGQISFEERSEIIQLFNSPDNKHGEKIKVLIASSAGAEGLDLKNIRQIHIMEPYWNEVKMEQVIGRGVRRESHRELPEDERNVEVFRYLAVLTPEQKLKADREEKETTDEYVYGVAQKKNMIKNELLQVMRESAFDCELNRKVNMKSKAYSCYKFPTASRGLAYLPDISYDIYSQGIVTKRVPMKLVKGIIQKSGDVIYGDKDTQQFHLATDVLHTTPYRQRIDPLKIVYIDLEKRSVYDYNEMKAGRKDKLGSYTTHGVFVPS